MVKIQSPSGANAVLAATETGEIALLLGAGVPADALAGYVHGCMYIRTDGTGATDAVYINQGTTTTTWIPLGTGDYT